MKEIKINMKNKFFWIAVIFTAALCFLSIIYNEGNRSYSLIDLLINNDLYIKFFSQLDNPIKLFKYGISLELSLFIIFVVSFSSINSIIEEKKSGYKRFLIIRMGHNKYLFKKILSSAILGGVILVLGYLIYIVLGTLLLNIVAFKKNFEFIDYDYIKFLKPISIKIIGLFLYGAFSTFPALALLAFTSNKYLISCIPLSLKYLFDASTSNIMLKNMNDIKYEGLYVFLNNLRLEKLIEFYYSPKSIIFILIYSLFFISIFIISEKRKRDYGK